jgi:hypothetical protein
MPLPTIPHDKALHVIYGAAAACIGALAAHLMELPPLDVAPAAALALGVAKEFYDKRTGRRGAYDPRDILATAVGALPVVVGLLVGAT